MQEVCNYMVHALYINNKKNEEYLAATERKNLNF